MHQRTFFPAMQQHNTFPSAPTSRSSHARMTLRPQWIRTQAPSRWKLPDTGLCAHALLSLFLILPMLSPFLVFSSETGMQTACCCKSDSECHCPYCKRHNHAKSQSSQPAFAAPGSKCPCCPAQLPSQLSIQFTPASVNPVAVDLRAHPSGLPQTEARQRLTNIRVRQKRGPPSLLIAS